MEYLRLAIALLLPWAGGFFWLAVAEARLNPKQPASALRQLGYGFFLGYAALQGMILASAAVFERVEFWPLFLSCALVTGVGSLFYRAAANRPSPRPIPQAQPAPDHPLSTAARVLLALLLGWAALHLALAAVESISRPVYPWDAWLAWAYRAKAWFYSGNVYALAAPREWLMEGAAPYTIAATRYPTFASIAPLWAALSLGTWNEQLVNTPVLLCGIALSLALYGQCREFGMSRLLGGATAYLLLSIPLLGTHLALGGYADIWLAGFTGLGFVALLRGLGQQAGFQILLGLAMVALGTAVKLEAVVWFYAAAATLVLTSVRITRSLAFLAAAALLATLAWKSGFHYAELPLVGGVGVVEGKVVIPFVGSHRLQLWDVRDAYLASFLAGGSWHLLWPMMAACAAGLVFGQSALARGRGPSAAPGRNDQATQKALIVFLLVFVASQFFIFALTEQGHWAQSYTAINRLPLHFSPALLFSCAVLVHLLRTPLAGADAANRGGLPGWRKPALAVLAATAITLAGTLYYLSLMHPGTDGEPRGFTPGELKLVVGTGSMAADKGVIRQFVNGLAVVTSGPVAIDTDQLKVAHIDTGGENTQNAAFFWRNQADPQQLRTLEIPGRGRQQLALGESAGWTGLVTEMGIFFYEDAGAAAEIYAITLAPRTMATNLSAVGEQWMQFQHWSQRSVNHTTAGARKPLLSLPLVVALWWLATSVMLVLLLRERRTAIATLCMGSLVAWMLLDVRWTANTLVQAGQTLAHYRSNGGIAHIDEGEDLALAEFILQVKTQVSGPRDTLLIVGSHPEMQFRLLRAKYHLLPLAAKVHRGPLKKSLKPASDYVLALRQHYLDPGEAPLDAGNYAAKLTERFNRPVTLTLDGPVGALFKLGRDSGPSATP